MSARDNLTPAAAIPECPTGYIREDGDLFRAFLKGANKGHGYLGVFATKREALDVLAVYRVMQGRDPDTGELV